MARRQTFQQESEVAVRTDSLWVTPEALRQTRPAIAVRSVSSPANQAITFTGTAYDRKFQRVGDPELLPLSVTATGTGRVIDMTGTLDSWVTLAEADGAELLELKAEAAEGVEFDLYLEAEDEWPARHILGDERARVRAAEIVTGLIGTVDGVIDRVPPRELLDILEEIRPSLEELRVLLDARMANDLERANFWSRVHAAYGATRAEFNIATRSLQWAAITGGGFATALAQHDEAIRELGELLS